MLLKGHTRGEDIFNAFMGIVSERRFTDIESIEPVASYMRYPIGPSIDVGDIAAKVKSLFDLKSSALEDEIL